MTNITRRKADTKDFFKAKQELVRILSDNKALSTHFVDELLTESEQVMLIKRFAAILMYKQGYSSYRVWNTLHVSPSTAERIYDNLYQDRYENLERALTIKRASGLLSLIEDIITAQVSAKARARLLKRTGW